MELLYLGKRFHAMGEQRMYDTIRFFTTDLNATVQVKEGISVYADIGNVLNRRAPVAPAAYASAPNYLITWHTPGVIGRTYKAGVRFEF